MNKPDLSSLSDWSQNDVLQNLEHLINQTYIAERNFNELTQLFKGVIDALPTALWVLNADGSILLNNEKARAARIDPASIRLEQNDTEIEVDNRFYILQVSKQNDKTIIVATDNTKSRRNERLIAMGQMAAHLAHEIRNPVGSVAILASTLFGRVDIRSKPLVLEIKKSIWRVERIVKATLLFSKGFTLNPRRFSLAELKEELETAVGNYSYSKPIRFEFDLPAVPVSADYDLLGLVLQNMLFNAIDAIEEHDDEEGCITIGYRDEEGLHALEVCDSGKPFENPERIFEAFYTTKTKGHGLGLILSRQIIEAHRGEIGLVPDRKGFLIRFEGVS
ncbi:MAG: PAS domain-containing sensor histidine kinase [Campylobacterales bacterium]